MFRGLSSTLVVQTCPTSQGENATASRYLRFVYDTEVVIMALKLEWRVKRPARTLSGATVKGVQNEAQWSNLLFS